MTTHSAVSREGSFYTGSPLNFRTQFETDRSNVEAAETTNPGVIVVGFF